HTRFAFGAMKRKQSMQDMRGCPGWAPPHQITTDGILAGAANLAVPARWCAGRPLLRHSPELCGGIAKCSLVIVKFSLVYSSAWQLLRLTSLCMRACKSALSQKSGFIPIWACFSTERDSEHLEQRLDY